MTHWRFMLRLVRCAPDVDWVGDKVAVQAVLHPLGRAVPRVPGAARRRAAQVGARGSRGDGRAAQDVVRAREAVQQRDARPEKRGVRQTLSRGRFEFVCPSARTHDALHPHVGPQHV